MEEISEVVMKKALGFSYTEENLEYEREVRKEFLYCEQEGRLYFGAGFIMAKTISKGIEIDEKLKKIKFCLRPKKYFKTNRKRLFVIKKN